MRDCGNGIDDAISTLSDLVCRTKPSYCVARDMLRVVGPKVFAHDLHTIAPWPLERVCWRQFAAQ